MCVIWCTRVSRCSSRQQSIDTLNISGQVFTRERVNFLLSKLRIFPSDDGRSRCFRNPEVRRGKSRLDRVRVRCRVRSWWKASKISVQHGCVRATFQRCSTMARILRQNGQAEVSFSTAFPPCRQLQTRSMFTTTNIPVWRGHTVTRVVRAQEKKKDEEKRKENDTRNIIAAATNGRCERRDATSAIDSIYACNSLCNRVSLFYQVSSMMSW